MRPRRLTALGAVALTVSLLGPAGAQADEPDRVTGSSLPEQASQTAREHAEDALAEAQGLFVETSPAASRRRASTGAPDATLTLQRLLRAYDDLGPADQRAADRLLARPTEGTSDAFGDGYTVPEATPACRGIVCVHYVTSTADAPPLTDTTPANGVPDEVDRALDVTEAVNATYAAAGYRRPDPDGSLGGGTDQVDIYLADIGAAGTYGYCTSDQPSTQQYHRWAYCVIDDDFSAGQFGYRNSAADNQRVTLAHEYFHAVQFAYDAFEDGWVMEGTAAWVEEQVFDAVDDNRQYLADSQLRHPGVPLDVYGDMYHYGTWIFFQYLTERWPGTTGTMPTLVLDLWNRMSARSDGPDDHSTQALQSVLAARETGFTTVYSEYADALRRPASTFAEGGAAEYQPALPAKTWRLSTSRRSTAPFYAELNHLTSLPLRYRPDSGLTRRDWKLRLTVDMPPSVTAPVARVARYLKDGSISTSTIPLRTTGSSSAVVGFSARTVRYVELVLVNTSRRSTCWSADGTFACSGTPLDDGARTDFEARIYRS